MRETLYELFDLPADAAIRDGSRVALTDGTTCRQLLNDTDPKEDACMWAPYAGFIIWGLIEAKHPLAELLIAAWKPIAKSCDTMWEETRRRDRLNIDVWGTAHVADLMEELARVAMHVHRGELPVAHARARVEAIRVEAERVHGEILKALQQVNS